MDESNKDPLTPKEQHKPVVKRKLTDQEQYAIARLKQRGHTVSKPLFQTATGNNENLELNIDEKLEPRDAIDLVEARIMEATGAVNSNIGLQIINNLGKALIPSKAAGKEVGKELDRIAQFMKALSPQDEYEGQLVAQLIILHEHALDWLGRAMRTERVDFANVYLNGASKLLARHHETLEALMKYRRKGELRVHVEHVHVHGGGQAIVGNVTAGGGMNQKFEEGPHAKV